MSGVQAAVLGLGTCLILLLSRRSLPHPRSHGFWRLFAFEALLILIVLNAPVWFRRPFAPRQVTSWLLLIASAALALHAIHLLHSAGRPGAETGEGPDLHWERTTRLVTTGAYRYIRHPMYASLLLLAAGAALKALTWPSVLLGLGILVAIVCTARADEAETAARFGREYAEYRARTTMFIPWLV
jgi:protein-S-isoprenylcysteine O-methyltransferase Ste14